VREIGFFQVALGAALAIVGAWMLATGRPAVPGLTQKARAQLGQTPIAHLRALGLMILTLGLMGLDIGIMVITGVKLLFVVAVVLFGVGIASVVWIISIGSRNRVFEKDRR
jgi:hypothetical protein